MIPYIALCYSLMATDTIIVNVTRLPNDSLLIHCGEKADSS